MTQKQTHLEAAKEVLAIEQASLGFMSDNLNDAFTGAVDAVLSTSGRLVVCGMGKSGLIGKKIAATLASTGTPSFSMHPGEAYHGDLGMVHPDDVFLAISNSGETEEVIRLLPFLKDNKNIVVSMTGKATSTLAVNADFHLNIGVEQEACPLQLAPTSSTTNTLAMGDALAVALMTARDFQPEHFARFHPGGSLGRRLLTRVRNVMAKDDLPLAASDSCMLEVVQVMTTGRKGVAVIKDGDSLKGVVTDGDVRRAMENFGADFMSKTAADVLTSNPKFIDADARLEEAKDLMNESNITALLVTDKDQFVGLIQLFDCAI